MKFSVLLSFHSSVLLFMANFKIFAFIFISLYLHITESIKCLSCSSEKEKQCSDLYDFHYTNKSSTSIEIIDCSDEAAVRQFIKYFSNLLSVLGVQTEVSTKFNTGLKKKKEKLEACQKVIINSESGQIVIRDCAVLSEIACDSLKSEAELSVSFCDICDTDYCNYSTKSVTNLNLVIIVVFVNAFIFNNYFSISSR